MRIYKNKNCQIIKIKINIKTTSHEGIHKNLFNYQIEEWKWCVNICHWLIIEITSSYIKKFFGSVVSLHYGNTLFIFLFNLEDKLSIKTALKFQILPYYKQSYTLLPILSSVGKLITFIIANKSYIFIQI